MKTTYIALIRGINVSGKNAIKMAPLRSLFENFGFTDVKTYLQSGNVVFRAGHESETRLCEKIAKTVSHSFGLNISVMVRSYDEIKKIVKANPFLKDKSVDVTELHVTFLSELPTDVALSKLNALPTMQDQFRILGREIYLYCPNGYGNTKLSNNAFERWLATSATTRNWKTVNALLELANL